MKRRDFLVGSFFSAIGLAIGRWMKPPRLPFEIRNGKLVRVFNMQVDAETFRKIQNGEITGYSYSGKFPRSNGLCATWDCGRPLNANGLCYVCADQTYIVGCKRLRLPDNEIGKVCIAEVQMTAQSFVVPRLLIERYRFAKMEDVKCGEIFRILSSSGYHDDPQDDPLRFLATKDAQAVDDPELVLLHASNI